MPTPSTVAQPAAALHPRDAVPERCDVLVVGGGILGLAVARELARRTPGQRIAVLEAEPRLAAHQTGHNSGVIHAGIYYAPGSLKAQLCVEGHELMYAFCEERGVDVLRCGKLIVASTPGEVPALRELERRGQANGVPGLRWLDGAALRELEPHAHGTAALHSPTTGVVDYAAVAVALAAEVRERGHPVTTSCRVARIERRAAGEVVVHHTLGSTVARHVVACAGAWADRLAVAAGATQDPRIVPFRGAYLTVRPERASLVRGLIYPVPDPRLPFLGVHLSRHVDGSVSIGPTALMVAARDAYDLRRVRAADVWSTVSWPGSWRMAWRFRATALAQVHRAVSAGALVRDAQRYVPELTRADVVAGPAGVRAQALGRDGRLVEDFVVSELDGMTHLRNAPSPAATASLAIARRVADRVGAALAA